MVKLMSCFAHFFTLILIIASCLGSVVPTSSSTDSTTTATFHPYRYQRLLLFFFSQDATTDFFTDTMDKLFQLDEYCGGQDLSTLIFIDNSLYLFSNSCKEFCFMKRALTEFYYTIAGDRGDYFNASIAWGVSSGSVDRQDVNNVTSKLLQALQMLNWEANSQTMNIKSQVILITDYATDSLQIESNNERGILTEMKLQDDISFIVLTTKNLTNETVNNYFPTKVWTGIVDYLSWTPNMKNPICGYKAQTYSKSVLIDLHNRMF
jgi:hypothetical protein